jgi:hypothetical protein
MDIFIHDFLHHLLSNNKMNKFSVIKYPQSSNFLVLGHDLSSTWNVAVDLLVQFKKEKIFIVNFREKSPFYSSFKESSSFPRELLQCLSKENLDIQFSILENELELESLHKKRFNNISLFIIFNLFSCKNIGGRETSQPMKEIIMNASHFHHKCIFLAKDPYVFHPTLRYQIQMDHVFALLLNATNMSFHKKKSFSFFNG